MTTATIKPCPFCQGTSFTTDGQSTGDSYVTCNTCKADGPIEAYPAQAIDSWNKAPLPFTLATLCAEYTEMHPNGSWEGDHPIMQMAAEIDQLKGALVIVQNERDQLKACLGTISSMATKNISDTSKGMYYCPSHGGHGFQSDCLTCKES